MVERGGVMSDINRAATFVYTFVRDLGGKGNTKGDQDVRIKF